MSYRYCDKCRDWKDCRGYPWYEPREIVFCRSQVLWLLLYSSLLEEGLYPPDPTPTGYVGGAGKPQFRSDGKFVTAASFFAELDWRLKRAKGDGETLRHEVQVLGAGYNGLSQAARNALYYVSGWKRKRDYGRWLTDRNRYVKLTQKA